MSHAFIDLSLCDKRVMHYISSLTKLRKPCKAFTLILLQYKYWVFTQKAWVYAKHTFCKDIEMETKMGKIYCAYLLFVSQQYSLCKTI